MVRPLRADLNSTVPGRVAKIVWSRPRPVPSPGQKRVPRWRTMISPPLTFWPAKTLTPSILGLDSRPLRLEPSPFLLAIVRILFCSRLFGGSFFGFLRRFFSGFFLSRFRFRGRFFSRLFLGGGFLCLCRLFRGC